MKLCSYPGCLNPFQAKDLCASHYSQIRKVGRLTPLNYKRNRTRVDDLRDLVAIEADDCTIWPHATTALGYPKVTSRLEGHRLSCEWTHGPAPTPTHQAAHSCGNPSCVNPRHLRWATPAENNGDKYVHGTHHRGERSCNAKLTNAQAAEIRWRYSDGGVSQRELAHEYNVSRGVVRNIVEGKTYVQGDVARRAS